MAAITSASSFPLAVSNSTFGVQGSPSVVGNTAPSNGWNAVSANNTLAGQWNSIGDPQPFFARFLEPNGSAPSSGLGGGPMTGAWIQGCGGPDVSDQHENPGGPGGSGGPGGAGGPTTGAWIQGCGGPDVNDQHEPTPIHHHHHHHHPTGFPSGPTSGAWIQGCGGPDVSDQHEGPVSGPGGPGGLGTPTSGAWIQGCGGPDVSDQQDSI